MHRRLILAAATLLAALVLAIIIVQDGANGACASSVCASGAVLKSSLFLSLRGLQFHPEWCNTPDDQKTPRATTVSLFHPQPRIFIYYNQPVMSHIINSSDPFLKFRLLLVVTIASGVLTAPTPMDPERQDWSYEHVSGHNPNSVETSDVELRHEESIKWPSVDVFYEQNVQARIEGPSVDVFVKPNDVFHKQNVPDCIGAATHAASRNKPNSGWPSDNEFYEQGAQGSIECPPYNIPYQLDSPQSVSSLVHPNLHLFSSTRTIWTPPNQRASAARHERRPLDRVPASPQHLTASQGRDVPPASRNRDGGSRPTAHMPPFRRWHY
ncbi:hypothetical protein SeMB42_g06705 [Synchytrium endobioticum]|uniref:Uncharacterized protein n=1 Tax=Synchytrium endobioticum TaxID=286115 RepID=A0A507CGY4_9FUNG|nr:hypothetical protein SeMB42_g06705 [Synchytrium endobioticum]